MYYSSNSSPSSRLEDPRDKSPSDLVAVLVPGLSVLSTATLLVSDATLDQEDSHENGVSPGKKGEGPLLGSSVHGQTSSSALRVGQDQVSEVVGVTDNSPPSRAQKNSLVLLSIGSVVLGLDDLGLLSPDDAVSLGLTSEILLVVDKAEDDVSEGSGSEKDGSSHIGEIVGIAGKVLSLESVGSGQPDHGSPSKVESVVVVANVNGAEVPVRVSTAHLKQRNLRTSPR